MYTIVYHKHATGNYIAKFENQSVLVLQGAFRSITGVSPQSSSGWTEVEKRELSKLGFIVR
ncbi:hypothetical protein ACP26L_25680 [Paenibacillus sp. S-38]|uniref:hypothetical protein n=1 Tax=Paenibacillus sp. S-38 TaxID=3416710 RepID=UPI003CE979B9